MARTLSVVAQQSLFRFAIAAALGPAVAQAHAAAQESIRVTTTQPRVIHNPFAPSGAERASQAEESPLAVKPSAAPPAAESTASPPVRLPAASILRNSSDGPATYRNPFAAGALGIAPPPTSRPPIMPGSLSRWRRSTAVPQESGIKSAILAAGAESVRPAARSDSIESTGMPWHRLPPAERLRNRHADEVAELPADEHMAELTEPIRFDASDLTQPEWMVPDDEAGPTTTTHTPPITSSKGFDPFEAAVARTIAAGEPASFDPVDDAPARSLQDALPIEPAGATVIISDEGNSAVAADALAHAEEAARTAQTAEELTAVTIECHRGLESGPLADDAVALRQLAAWAYNRRGELALAAGNDQDALRDFEAAIEVDGECWLALHNRGVTLAQQNELAAALEDFNRVVQLNPGLAIAYRNRGELLAALGRMEDAVRDYSDAMEHLPHDASLYSARGYAYHRLGNYERALVDLNQSIKLAPDQPDVYTQRGNIHAERGNFVAAINDLEKAVALDASRAEAHRSLAWLRATCPDGRYRDAVQALASAQQAVELSAANDCFMLDALAAAHASAGQFHEAVQVQRQALAAASPDVAPSLQQRLVLYQRGEAFRSGPQREVRTASHETSGAKPRPSPAVRSRRQR